MAKKVTTKIQKKNRVALQPAGMPQGNHLTGFKGTKADEECFCGGCHPNARANAKRARVIQL